MSVSENDWTTRDREARRLIEQCAKTDVQALADLYSAMSRVVYRELRTILRRPALAEEATHDVFLTVWVKAATFSPERGTASGWIRMIARNRAFDLLRRERRSPVLDLCEETQAEDIEDPPPQTWLLKLAKCIERLPADQRQFVQLAFLENKTHIEVAALLGRPLGSVKSGIRRGLIQLRACLEQVEGPERH